METCYMASLFIRKNGAVTQYQIMKSLGNNGCDEAAMAAIKAAQWQPAKSGDKPVKVWVSISIKFALK